MYSKCVIGKIKLVKMMIHDPKIFCSINPCKSVSEHVVLGSLCILDFKATLYCAELNWKLILSGTGTHKTVA